MPGSSGSRCCWPRASSRSSAPRSAADPPGRAPGRAARLAGGDRAGGHQLPAAAEDRGRTRSPGMAALAVILATLTARWRLPWGMPGALGAVIVGCLVYYGMKPLELWLGLAAPPPEPGADLPTILAPGLPMPMAGWWDWFQVHWREALNYLPVAPPAGPGDGRRRDRLHRERRRGRRRLPDRADHRRRGARHPGRRRLRRGHPDDALHRPPGLQGDGRPGRLHPGDGRCSSAAVGMLGFFAWIFRLLPEVVVFPILIFIGLEITAQSFLATPRRHYPALALAVVPALAYLVEPGPRADRPARPGPPGRTGSSSGTSCRGSGRRSARSRCSPAASSSRACSGRPASPG